MEVQEVEKKEIGENLLKGKTLYWFKLDFCKFRIHVTGCLYSKNKCKNRSKFVVLSYVKVV